MEQVTKRPTFEEWQQLLREPIQLIRFAGKSWAGGPLGQQTAHVHRGDELRYSFGGSTTVYPDTDIYYHD